MAENNGSGLDDGRGILSRVERMLLSARQIKPGRSCCMARSEYDSSDYAGKMAENFRAHCPVVECSLVRVEYLKLQLHAR